MTARQLAELIQRRLAGGDPSDDFPIEIPEIILAIGAYRDQIITDRIMSGLMDGKDLPPVLLKTTILPVLAGEAISRGRNYVELPAYMDLPGGYGINAVWDGISGEDYPYTILMPGEYAILRSTYAGSLQGRSGFYPEGQVGLLINLRQDTENVYVRYIPSTATNLDGSDDLAVPDEIQAEIMERILRIYGVKIEEDNSNDGVSA